MTSVLGKRKHEPNFEPVQAWVEKQVLKIDEIPDEEVVVNLETKLCQQTSSQKETY